MLSEKAVTGAREGERVRMVEEVTMQLWTREHEGLVYHSYGSVVETQSHFRWYFNSTKFPIATTCWGGSKIFVMKRTLPGSVSVVRTSEIVGRVRPTFIRDPGCSASKHAQELTQWALCQTSTNLWRSYMKEITNRTTFWFRRKNVRRSLGKWWRDCDDERWGTFLLRWHCQQTKLWLLGNGKPWGLYQRPARVCKNVIG